MENSVHYHEKVMECYYQISVGTQGELRQSIVACLNLIFSRPQCPASQEDTDIFDFCISGKAQLVCK